MKRTILAAALSSLLLLTACGDDGEGEAKKNISTALQKEEGDSALLTLDEKEADCIADGMVDGIGVDKLKEYKYLKKDGTVNEDAELPDMSEKDAEAFTDALFDCTDAVEVVKEQFRGSMGTASKEMQTCIEDALSEKVVRALLVASFSGADEASSQKALEPITACATAGMGEQPSPSPAE